MVNIKLHQQTIFVSGECIQTTFNNTKAYCSDSHNAVFVYVYGQRITP